MIVLSNALILRTCWSGYISRNLCKELQAVILTEIRTEYQHNVTQQLYVSSANWNVLRKLKEDTISMFNNAVAGLPADASG
ncbi:hypothetical protein CS542_10575 [Pedobacter sp. IW39]|nr:hypothetical protein CS542_10575 [Pedobacter sp. IW39]